MYRSRHFYHTEHLNGQQKRVWSENTPPPQRVELKTFLVLLCFIEKLGKKIGCPLLVLGHVQ